MLKVEGENRIDIESIVGAIAEECGISDKQALKFFCKALHYDVVVEAIYEQINYLLELGIIKY